MEVTIFKMSESTREANSNTLHVPMDLEVELTEIVFLFMRDIFEGDEKWASGLLELKPRIIEIV